MDNLYFNRDLSLLEFNRRVLAQAQDAEVPLLDRLRFLCISCTNLDEFFEIATLVQTKKIEPIPIILVHKEYWTPLLDWINKTLYEKNRAINKEDMSLYHVADDAKEALQLIKKMVV